MDRDPASQYTRSSKNPHSPNTANELARALSAAAELREIVHVRHSANELCKRLASDPESTYQRLTAAETKLRAERRAGGILAQLKLRGGDRRSERPEGRTSLHDLGISKDQSSKWQKVAAVPEAEFERFIETCHQFSAEITTARLLRSSTSKPLPRMQTNAGTIPGNRSSDAEVIQEICLHANHIHAILEPVLGPNSQNKPLTELQKRYVGRLLSELIESARFLCKEP